jgi:hypothetical protein
MLIEELEKLLDDKLIELTEEDIERIVMFNIADRGIYIEMQPFYEILANIKNPTHSFYRCALFGSLLFPDAKSFEEMRQFAVDHGIKREGIDYHFDNNCVFLDFEQDEWGNRLEKPLSMNSYYSEGEYVDLSEVLSKNKKIEEGNKLKSEKYNKYLAEKNNIKKEVEDIIDGAHRRIRDKKQEEEKFKMYLQIAENNYDIAMAFYMKANDGKEDMKKHIDHVYGKDLTVPE